MTRIEAINILNERLESNAWISDNGTSDFEAFIQEENNALILAIAALRHEEWRAMQARKEIEDAE